MDLSDPKVMGIVNLTPDSFYEVSRVGEDRLIEVVGKMLEDGADIIDLGGYSSRHGASEVSQEEELRRVVSAVKHLIEVFPNCCISVDTFRSKVAEESIRAGASMINDISGGNLDERMWRVVSDFQVPYIVMHMRGTPQTMMKHTKYDNMLSEISYYFSVCKEKAYKMGLNDLIIDVGFGFSKTLEQNYELLQNLEYFQNLELPILVGVSRKSMIYKYLNITPEESLNGTQILHSVAVRKGARILRAHDVKETVETVKLLSYVKSFPKSDFKVQTITHSKLV